MGFIRRFYEGTITVGSFCQHLLLFGLRLYWGFSFFQAGWGKLNGIAQTRAFFETLGIPFPEANAYLVGGVEAIGGLFLLFGFASRFAAIPLAITMLVALLTAHADITRELIAAVVNIYQELGVFMSHASKFIVQEPFNYLLTCLIIFCFGPGSISIDYIFEKIFSFRKK